MGKRIRLGIVGYGNLGKGAVWAAGQNPDLQLQAIFTRRDPETVEVEGEVPLQPIRALSDWKGELDVLVLCAGSAKDLPAMTPALAEHFSLVDSFDRHSEIPAHFAAVDAAARKGGTLALISAGWDPGLLSLARLYGAAALPQGESATFWGKGVSQGHSNALRRLPGVLDAKQYTIPIPAMLQAVREGKGKALRPQDLHRRVCYVAAEPGRDLAALRREIETLPGYFAGYQTEVQFVSLEELHRDHSGQPHGGGVIRSGVTGPLGERRQRMECSLTLDSNPEFTASVLLSCARAVHRMRQRGEAGCRTLLDVAPSDLASCSPETLRAQVL